MGLLLLPVVTFSTVKTSISNGSWGNAANWSPYGVPATGDKVKIYHVITLNVNFTASDTIFVYNTLNLSGSKTLSLSPGTMILVNDATYNGRLGSVGSSANIVGNFTFQKWISRCDGYSTFGTPFTQPVQNFDWYYCNQCMSSSWSNIYYYDETDTGVLDSGYYDNVGGNLQRGKGFFYWYSNYTGGDNFPRKISLTGSLNLTSSFNFSVSYTSSGTGFSNDGFNLVSNPYPGTIDWNSGSWNRNNVGSAIYTWNNCSNTYAVYMSGYNVNGGSRYIPSMQGFWVQAYSGNPSMSADAGVMVSNNQSMLKTGNTESADHSLRLSLQEDEIVIHLDGTATSAFDPNNDAIKFFAEGSKISCGTNDSTKLEYAIQSVGLESQVIPVSVKGGGTLQITGFESFADEYAITLRDLTTNELIPVNGDKQYSFSGSPGNGFQKRFLLYFNRNINTGIRVNQLEQVEVIKQNDVIHVFNPDPESSTVRVFDLQGRLLFSGSFVQQVDLPDPKTPVLIWIDNSKGSYSKKMF